VELSVLANPLPLSCHCAHQSPLPNTINSNKVNCSSFDVDLDNRHVIQSHQIWVGVLAKASDGTPLKSAYDARSNTYLKGIGLTILSLSRAVPDGLLVFFPSYKLLEECLAIWKAPPPSVRKTLHLFNIFRADTCAFRTQRAQTRKRQSHRCGI